MTDIEQSQKREVLLVLMLWEVPEAFIQQVTTENPGLEVITYTCGRYDTTVPSEVSKETWARVTALFTWHAIPPKELAPNLEFVQLLSAGCDHAAESALFRDTDVAFCTANGAHPPQMAEWVMATFIAFQHHLYTHWDNQKNGLWVTPESDEDQEDAVGLRMGILGYGNIGRQCARVAKAVGMDVHAFTLHDRKTPGSRRHDSIVEAGLGDPDGIIPSQWFYDDAQLNEFISGLDVLVLAVPLTAATKGMIGAEQLEALGKRNGFLCNVARGAVVKTDDLIVALNSGVIKGAALDVTDPEPLPKGHPLWSAKNVIITPHGSGNSTQYNQRVMKVLAENLRRRNQGRPLINKVDRILGY